MLRSMFCLPRSSLFRTRPVVIHALTPRAVLELAREADELQQRDRRRLERYQRASQRYLREFQAADIGALPLREAHMTAIDLATNLLPAAITDELEPDAAV